jgi:hypothetical protein
MSIQQQVRFEWGLLTVEANGEFSIGEAKRAFLEILAAVAQYRAEKVLFDGRNVKGNPREFERFLYGEFAAQETMKLKRSHKIVPQFAYVLHEPLCDRGRYGETVAVNRGMNIKVLATLEEGFKWLGFTPGNKPDAGDA